MTETLHLTKQLELATTKITSTTVMVDAEMAKRWLTHNVRNRPIRQTVVAKYKADMRAGRWLMAGDPIRFIPPARSSPPTASSAPSLPPNNRRPRRVQVARAPPTTRTGLEMSTTIVTPEVQRPQHFVSCDEQAVGRRVLRFARHDNLGPVTAVPLEILLSDLDEDRPACRCFAIQLDRVEADLAARRRAQRAGFDRTEEIAALTAARAAIKAAMKATR